MTAILKDLSFPSLAVAVKANLYAFFRSIRHSSETSVDDGAHGFRWHTSFSHPWFNGVLVGRPPVAGAAQTVRETLAYFQHRGVDAFSWWLTPSVEPTAWSQHLLPHGFQYDDNTPGMGVALADLPPLPPAGQRPFTVRPARDHETLATWARTLIRGFQMPEAMAGPFLAIMESLGTDLPVRHYLGLVNGEPVATSTLFLGAGVAGIYNVATLPEARGRGIGSAMSLAPLYEARDLGYHAGVLQASKMGYGVYRRLGFQKLCQIDHFSWQIPDTRVNSTIK